LGRTSRRRVRYSDKHVRYAIARSAVIVRMHAMRTAETSSMVRRSSDRARCAGGNGRDFLDFGGESGRGVPVPHILSNAKGKKMVHIVRHSSAFRDPALAAPNFFGTDLTHDGVAVSLMTSRMRSRMSKDGRGIWGGLLDSNGWLFRYKENEFSRW
jgi:hypothetical protein